MHLVVSAMKGEASQEAGLSPLQLQILIDLLSRHPHPQTVVFFGQRYATARGTVSESIAGLVRKRLVAKRRSKDDRRSVNVSLTAKGLRHAIKLSRWAETLLESVTDIPRAYQQAMLQALIRVIGGFSARGLIGVDRMCVTCKHFERNKRLGMPKAHRCSALKIALGDADLRLDCNTYEMGKKALALLARR